MSEDYSTIGAVAYEAGIAELQAAMAAGNLSASELVAACIERIERIDRAGPRLGAVLELNPEALSIAAARDAERAAGQVRGPLHGIPVLLKDNIDTADATVTTAGSLALLGSRPAADAGVVRRLREAGAVLLGKTNLSEWANFRGERSTSGWSARGGQTRNPYVLDRTPCGSSSGSAVAVAASLCVVAIGSETDGSIVCPSSICGVVGIKPTVGLTSRAGVIPISATQDTIGPHARTVADAALALGAIAGPDEADPATAAAAGCPTDYSPFLDPEGLRGARIGVLRGPGFIGYSRHTDAAYEAAIGALREAGAILSDPVQPPNEPDEAHRAELTVLLYEFKDGLNRYLASRLPDPQRPGPLPRSLADLIAFNEANRAAEMPFFEQELFLKAEATSGLDAEEYRAALAASRDGARAILDGLFDGLDALVAPTGGPAWTIDPINGDHFGGGSASLPARAGYPVITVPAGSTYGLPLGLSFIGPAFSEPALIRLAFAFEQATRLRRPPTFRPTLLEA